MYALDHKDTIDETTTLATVASAPFPGAEDVAARSEPEADLHVIAAGGQVAPIPFMAPNVRVGHEREDIAALANGQRDLSAGCGWWLLSTAICCLPSCCNATLVPEGLYGLALDNGRPHVLFPGWHVLLRPFTRLERTVSASLDLIQFATVSIVRVRQGHVGLAMNNALPELLLPGVHVRNSAAFRYLESKDLAEPVITLGPVKVFYVPSGAVRICSRNGIVEIYKEGRYAVNAANFQVGNLIATTQQNLRFDQHSVLLDGGINLLVEGLLTYQVVQVAQLIKQLGQNDLKRAITDITKAELARVFAGIHLEQISSAAQQQPPPPSLQMSSVATEIKAAGGGRHPSDASAAGSIALLGGGSGEGAGLRRVPVAGFTEGAEATTRSWICHQVIQDIAPLAAQWGVEIINFQLESTRIADQKYAREYEEATLALAKAKANRRALDAQNDIMIQTARAHADAVRIEAEGRRQAMILEAQGHGEARKVEAKARNEAAMEMTSDFARQFAMANQQVEVAKALRAHTLVIAPDTTLARAFLRPSVSSAAVADNGNFTSPHSDSVDLADAKRRT